MSDALTGMFPGGIVGANDIAAIDANIKAMPRVDAPVKHRFSPGLYTREIFMPAGSAHRSKIHKSNHQFIVSQGACMVSENGGPSVLMVAPFHGETKPGTWRALLIIMDCIWTTMHVTDKTDLAEIEKDLILEEEKK